MNKCPKPQVKLPNPVLDSTGGSIGQRVAATVPQLRLIKNLISFKFFV
jgi:hypothetical protein